VAEGGHAPVRLLPDLASEPVAVVGDDVGVVELVGGVVVGLCRELRGAGDHVVDVLRRDVGAAGDGRDDVEFGAERAHELEALFREAVGDDDQCPIALRAADERECGAGAAAGVLDHRVLGRDQPVSLCALDHRERNPVLEGSGRVSVFELQPELGAVRRRAAPEPDEGCVADRVKDGFHAGIILHGRRGERGRRP